jgi:hypothetical protein
MCIPLKFVANLDQRFESHAHKLEIFCGGVEKIHIKRVVRTQPKNLNSSKKNYTQIDIFANFIMTAYNCGPRGFLLPEGEAVM